MPESRRLASIVDDAVIAARENAADFAADFVPFPTDAGTRFEYGVFDVVGVIDDPSSDARDAFRCTGDSGSLA
jgi:hypothetical protein